MGVVPYMNVDIEDEDSLSEAERKIASKINLANPLNDLKDFDLKRYKEGQYDILATCFRKSIDMDKIYEITGIKR